MPAVVTGLLAAVFGVVGFMFFAVYIGLYQAVVDGDLPSIALRSYITVMVLIGYLTVAHVYLSRCTTQHNRQLCSDFGFERQLKFPLAMLVVPLTGWLQKL